MIALWLVFLLLAACGDDGNTDTLWTGGSAIVLAAIVSIVLWKIYKNRSR